MILYKRELDKAIELAYKAGMEIMKFYSDNCAVTTKKDGSLLTEADLASNDIIVSGLKKEFPDHAVLSEETKDSKVRINSKYCWIVDPLDGTQEFVNRTGEFTVNIALDLDGVPVVGVIYVPVVNTLYYASKHSGAWKLSVDKLERIRVSSKAKHMRVVASRSHKSKVLDELIKQAKDRVTEVISKGSSLKGCYIAEGRAEAYYRFGLTSEWDTAAMHIVVEEAGGVFQQLNGDSMSYNRINTLNENGFFVLNKLENKL